MRLRASALLVLAVVACHACKEEQRTAPKPPPPLPADALYARGRKAMQEGDTAAAERFAHEGEKRFAAQPVWRELFAILDAESNREHAGVLQHTPQTRAALPAIRRHLLSGRYDDADALASHVLPELRPEIAVARGRSLARAGQWPEAERYTQLAIGDAKNPALQASAYGQLGYIAMKQQQWPRAIDGFTTTIQYARAAQMPTLEMKAMANRGYCRLKVGDYDEAIKDLRPAAEQSAEHRYQGMALIHIADIYIRRQEFDTATPYAEKALRIANDRQQIADSSLELCNIEFEHGNYDAAKAWHAKAVKARPKGDVDGALSDRWMNARIVAKSNPVQALQMLDSLLTSSEVRNDLTWLWRVQKTEGEVNFQIAKFPEAERWDKETLVTAQKARETVRGTDAALAFERNLLSVYDNYIELLVIQGRNAEALRIAEQSRGRALRESRSGTAVDLVAVAREKNATILYYWIQGKRSLLWTVTPRGIDVVKLDGENAIDKLADAYREEMQHSRRPPGTSELGIKLYETLVAPAKIAPGSRVIISPDAHLRALSFDALIVREPKPHYWIEDVTISYAPSLYLLASGPAWNGIGAGRALVFGNVPAEGRDFPKLAQAQKEIDDIVRHFGASVVVLSGTRATPASYVDAHPKDYQIIHFAAHAVAPPDAPLSAAVILAPDAKYGYSLTGKDILHVPLDAELVTLSSCNSAGRRNYAGEGLVGLTWAFLGAGAHRVVAAQWEVSDSAAPKIMDKMYEGIRNGVEPAEALRQAKLSLLKSGRIFARPLYWAPFGIYGAL